MKPYTKRNVFGVGFQAVYSSDVAWPRNWYSNKLLTLHFVPPRPAPTPPPRPCAAFEEVGIDELQVNRVIYRLNDTREAHREGRGARTMLQV